MPGGGGGGRNVGTIRIISGPLFMSGLGPLVIYGTGVNHSEYFYQICQRLRTY